MSTPLKYKQNSLPKTGLESAHEYLVEYAFTAATQKYEKTEELLKPEELKSNRQKQRIPNDSFSDEINRTGMDICESPHDKTNKMTVRPAKTDQPGHLLSLISLHCVVNG